MRILFITANRIGDAVLTTGLYGHLATLYPTARFTVACGPLAAPLFAAAPGLAELIVLAKRRYAAHWLELWRRAAPVRWDLVVDLRDSLVSRLVLARRRVILSGRSAAAGPPRHKVETLAALFGLSPPPAPRLWLDDGARRAADALLKESGGGGAGDGPLLALAPTANWTAKEWPPERFGDVARRLLADDGPLAGGRVMALAAPAEAARARAALAGLPPAQVVDLIGRTDALTAAACISRAALFIGNDSGLMHIAAATGVPTLGLFGPGYPEIYGPWGDNAAVVVSDAPAAELRARVTPADRAPVGLMDGIAVAAVMAAATRRLTAKD